MFRFESCIEESPVNRHGQLLPIDQFNAQDFNIGANGWIVNPINALNRAQTLEQARLILSSMTEQKGHYNIPEGMSLTKAFDYIRPRYAQSEQEVLAFAEQLGKVEQSEIDAAYAKALKDEVISSDKPSDVSSSNGD